MKQTFLEKSSEKIWKLEVKVIIFAPTFAKRMTKKFFERFTYQQVVQEDVKNTKKYRQGKLELPIKRDSELKI